MIPIIPPVQKPSPKPLHTPPTPTTTNPTVSNNNNTERSHQDPNHLPTYPPAPNGHPASDHAEVLCTKIQELTELVAHPDCPFNDLAVLETAQHLLYDLLVALNHRVRDVRVSQSLVATATAAAAAANAQLGVSQTSSMEPLPATHHLPVTLSDTAPLTASPMGLSSQPSSAGFPDALFRSTEDLFRFLNPQLGTSDRQPTPFSQDPLATAIQQHLSLGSGSAGLPPQPHNHPHQILSHTPPPALKPAPIATAPNPLSNAARAVSVMNVLRELGQPIPNELMQMLEGLSVSVDGEPPAGSSVSVDTWLQSTAAPVPQSHNVLTLGDINGMQPLVEDDHYHHPSRNGASSGVVPLTIASNDGGIEGFHGSNGSSSSIPRNSSRPTPTRTPNLIFPSPASPFSNTSTTAVPSPPSTSTPLSLSRTSSAGAAAQAQADGGSFGEPSPLSALSRILLQGQHSSTPTSTINTRNSNGHPNNIPPLLPSRAPSTGGNISPTPLALALVGLPTLPAPSPTNPHVFAKTVFQVMRVADAQAKADWNLGWVVLRAIWNITPADFEDHVLQALFSGGRTPQQREEVLLALAAVDLRNVRNLNGFLGSLIKEHEALTQLCIRYFAGICDFADDPSVLAPEDPHRCCFVHPGHTMGWEILRQRWNIAFRDMDYGSISYLCKQPAENRDAILASFADMNLKNVKNLSAYLSRAIRMHEAPSKAR